MRFVAVPTVVAALVLTPPARAEGPDPALAIAIGAATLFVGFAVGGAVIASSPGRDTRTEAGWLAIESGFAVAPLASHAVVGEWARGAAFAAIPAATTLATIPVFLVNGAAVESATLPQERFMWGLFCAGLAASMAGVVDSALAPGRAVRIAPVLGARNAGLVVSVAL